MTATIEHVDVTLMFTDIVGYSKLMGQNQALTITLVEDYRAILLKEIEAHQGSIIEFIGDAVFARFATAQRGVDAGVAIQKAIFTYNRFRDKNLPQLHTRIGLHTGCAAQKNGALFGDDVNIAARLEPLAYTDGICISEPVYRAIAATNKTPILPLGVQRLKNIEARVRVWLLRPEGITINTRLYYWHKGINRRLGAYRYAIAGLCAVLLIAAWYFVPRILVPGYDANYIEVAEFKNAMPDNSEWNYLSRGITEAVRSQLADMREVFIVDSGEGVQAPLVLEGNLQRLGDNIRIAYRLIRREGMVQIAGGKLDGTFEEIFILQDRLVAEIAGFLSEEFRIESLRPAKAEITSSVTAYDYYLRGLDYLERPLDHANSDQAINNFSTALFHDNRFAEAEAGLCQSYWKKYLKSHSADWLESAERHCTKALKLNPTLAKAVESMGLLYTEQGRYEEAIAMLDEVWGKDKDNIQAINGLADLYSKLDEFEKAESLLQDAVERQPKNWRLYSRLGFLYLKNGRLDEAVEHYEKVLKLTPKNVSALNNLGVSYFFKGRFAKAKSAYEKAVGLNPNSWGYSNVGLMDYYSGDFSSAKNMFKRAIQASPDDYLYHVNLGDLLRQMDGEEASARAAYRKGVALLEKIVTLKPSDAEANALLANCYTFLGDGDKAQAFLKKAVELNPRDPIILSVKARLETVAGDYESAVDTLKTLRDQGWSKELIVNDPDYKAMAGVEVYETFMRNYNRKGR